MFTLNQNGCSLKTRKGVHFGPEYASPQQAKKFKTLKKAISIMNELEISQIAVVAPAFDVGTEIVVFAEASPTKGETANPLRIKN